MEPTEPFRTQYLRLIDGYRLPPGEDRQLLLAVFRRMEDGAHPVGKEPEHVERSKTD